MTGRPALAAGFFLPAWRQHSRQVSWTGMICSRKNRQAEPAGPLRSSPGGRFRTGKRSRTHGVILDCQTLTLPGKQQRLSLFNRSIPEMRCRISRDQGREGPRADRSGRHVAHVSDARSLNSFCYRSIGIYEIDNYQFPKHESGTILACIHAVASTSRYSLHIVW